MMIIINSYDCSKNVEKTYELFREGERLGCGEGERVKYSYGKIAKS